MQRFDPDRMKRLRKAAGMTQVQAAAKAGITQGRWSHVESGNQDDVGIVTLAMIADALGCEVQDLLTSTKTKGTRAK
jgi:transcriptional regulator with XRE-family HTH domain